MVILMENWQIFAGFGVIVLLIACFCAILIFLFRTYKNVKAAFLAYGASVGVLNERMAALEIARVGAQQFAARGVQAREQYSARRQAAIFEAIAAYKAGNSPKDILIAVAQKYPDVAVQIVQNPDVVMQDIKRLGIDLPPELLQQLGQTPPKTPPEGA